MKLAEVKVGCMMKDIRELKWVRFFRSVAESFLFRQRSVLEITENEPGVV